MKMTAKRVFILFLFMGLMFAGACSSVGRYGKLNVEPRTGGGVTLEKLVQNWKDYDVHYAGVSLDQAAALLFDPKSDGRRVEPHEWWSKVEDQETLKEIVAWMNLNQPYEKPTLYQVLGPDGRLFGYLYTMRTGGWIEARDENTLWIEDMSLRPDYSGGDVLAPQ